MVKQRKHVVIEENKHTLIKTMASKNKRKFEDELDKILEIGLKIVKDT
jgi:hypothetical protein